MSKHIAYFVLQKNHETFKKGAKTEIRKRLGDFFEINKKNGIQIKFREDKWNKELFKPIFSNMNINKLEKDLIKEFNKLLDFSVKIKVEKLGLIITTYLSWTDDVYYSIQEIEVSLDPKFYKTKIEKQIGYMLEGDFKHGEDVIESMISKEIKQGNKKIKIFLNKCDNLSKQVGFDVFETFLN